MIFYRRMGCWVVWAVLEFSSLLRAQIWQVDTTFAPVLESAQSDAFAVLTPTSAGKILVYAPYAVNGSLTNSGFLRLNGDGTVDHTYQPPVDVWYLVAIGAYSDGRVLARRGIILPNSGGTRTEIIRLLANGMIDPAFAPVAMPDASDQTGDIQAQVLSDGRVLLSGNFSKVGTAAMFYLALLNADGSLSTSFQSPLTSPSPANTGIYAVLPLADGRIVVTGGFTGLGTAKLKGIARLNADGSVDLTFNANAVGFAQGPNRLYIGTNGSLLVTDGTKLVRLDIAGTRDASFAPQLVGSQITFGAQQSDGKIYYLTVNSSSQPELRRLNADGTADAAFVLSKASGPGSPVGLPTIGSDGSLFVANTFPSGQSNFASIARIRPDGSLDPAFHPRISRAAAVGAFLLQPDGKTLVVGQFAFVNGSAATAATSFVRLNADGSTDTGFVPNLGTGESISRLYFQPGGKVIASGTFNLPGGGSGSFTRFNRDGTRDATFHFQPTSTVTIALDGDGNIYAEPQGGSLPLARYSPDGTPDLNFQAAVSGPVGFVPLADGTVLISYGATRLTSPTVVRLRHDGTVNPAFQPTQDFNSILSIAGLPDGRVAVAETVSGQFSPSVRVTRLDPNGRVDYTYLSPPTNISTLYSDAAALIVAGALLDHMRESGASPGTTLNVTWGGTATLAVSADGRTLVQASFDGLMLASRRTAQPGPSVDPVPTILLQLPLQARTVPLHGRTSVSATASGLYPLTYQWYKDGIALVGANFSVLDIRDPATTDAGKYTLTVSNAYGVVTTTPVSIAVDPTVAAPAIAQQPQNQTVGLGGTANFSVTATGIPPPTFQWTFNGRALAGATGATLTLTNVQASQTGSYDVLVSSTVRTGGSTVSYGVQSVDAVLAVTQFSMAGTYFGKFGGGNIALTVRGDGTAALLITLAASGRAIIANNFTPAADGSFSANGISFTTGPGATSGALVTLTGSLARDGSVTGSVAGEGLAFAAVRTTTSSAELYEARPVGAAAGILYALSDSSGNAVVAAVAGSSVVGGAGTLGTGGQLTLRATNGNSLDLTINAATGSVSASGSGATMAAVSFTGVRDDVVLTDRLADISTRGPAGVGDEALIAGFVITGSAPRPVLIRAIGPALGAFGVSGSLAAPRLTLFRDGSAIGTNDAWGANPRATEIAAAAARVGAFALPTTSADSSIIATLSPGNYTASVTSVDGGSGTALVEVYDVGDPAVSTAPRLINIATRGRVGPGNLLTAGIVVTGNAPKRLLVRAVGPTLGLFGVANALADPGLTILRGQTTIAGNDDWSSPAADAVGTADIALATAAVGAFALPAGSKDACLLLTLQPGSYTAQVGGNSGASGAALVEVYEVP